MYQTVLSERAENGVRTITLNRPERLNAMNATLVAETARAFEAAHADPATRAIVFTGAGRAFCAGDDLREHRHPRSQDEAQRLVAAIQRVTDAIVLGPKPVVGAINGWAVGGGFEWAINCDFPLWARSARAFFPELSWGLFVTGGVTALLPALVGLNKAREMLYLGERYDAPALLEMGVAWKVVEDAALAHEAHGVAERLATLPPAAVGDMKRALNLSGAASLRAAMDFETGATVRGFLDPHTSERIARFAQPD